MSTLDISNLLSEATLLLEKQDKPNSSEPPPPVSFSLDKNSEEIRLLTYLEVQYNLTGDYPKLEDLARYLKQGEVYTQSLIIHVEQKLEARGLPKYFKEKKYRRNNLEFDPLFILACNSILNVTDTRSMAAKLKELEPVGINARKWDHWMEIPKNRKYFLDILNNRFDKQVEDSAKLALARNINAGDLQSIKYYNELTNKYRPTSQNEVLLATLISMIMQILAKHVDSRVIEIVANEFEELPLPKELLA